ncbi:hypothetical protein F4W09_02000 [Acinetobacter tandoii]|uniref:Uncharacterized protein n=1 Tax=Acinetobacter tandoii TaxID=202954 RepID=A0A5N4WU63_9GAMM|nr:hypothetical protein F4W09_02000 [Acinetobacter tandoii]
MNLISQRYIDLILHLLNFYYLAKTYKSLGEFSHNYPFLT